MIELEHDLSTLPCLLNQWIGNVHALCVNVIPLIPPWTPFDPRFDEEWWLSCTSLAYSSANSLRCDQNPTDIIYPGRCTGFISQRNHPSMNIRSPRDSPILTRDNFGPFYQDNSFQMLCLAVTFERGQSTTKASGGADILPIRFVYFLQLSGSRL